MDYFRDIDYIVKTFIIIKDYTFSHEINSSKLIHECILTIKKFSYSKNKTDIEDYLQVKYVCEDMKVKESLRAKGNKQKLIGWNVNIKFFYFNSKHFINLIKEF